MCHSPAAQVLSAWQTRWIGPQPEGGQRRVPNHDYGCQLAMGGSGTALRQCKLTHGRGPTTTVNKLQPSPSRLTAQLHMEGSTSSLASHEGQSSKPKTSTVRGDARVKSLRGIVKCDRYVFGLVRRFWFLVLVPVAALTQNTSHPHVSVSSCRGTCKLYYNIPLWKLSPMPMPSWSVRLQFAATSVASR